MITSMIVAAWVGFQPSPGPGLPTPPPPLPTYVVDGDGTRHNCTPQYQQCWLPDVFE